MVVVDLADTAFRRRNRDRGMSLKHLANLIAQDRILAEFRSHDHTSALEQIRRVLSLRRVGVDELVGEREWLKVAVHRPVDARSRGEVDGDFLCFSAEALKRLLAPIVQLEEGSGFTSASLETMLCFATS